MRYSGPPPSTVHVPAPIATLAEGRPLLPVWQNELGGLTFRIGGGEDGRLFAKWAPAGSGLDLAAEAERMGWAGRFTPVPRVREHGTDADGAAWLVTHELSGSSAVSDRWKADPGTAVRALGAGLRALHERLPVAECSFSWSVDHRLERARRDGMDVPADLPEPPPIDRLVVCHGDPCAPNTLLHQDGSWSGHVDMGALGVADRWADLAVATWSTEWNYGPGWEDALLDAYGIAPDPHRTAFYRRLWSVT
jgi:kanamycin kinase